MSHIIRTNILLIAVAIVAVFVTFDAESANKRPAPFTVVVDAGHGGKDIGAVGDKAREKDVNLGVALKLRKLIEKQLGDAKVVMTRESDRFVPLQRRADIANEANGNLFISIHCNSVAKSSKNRDSVRGTSVYVLGRKSEENLAVAQRENSVIMLEDDYSTTYHGFDPNSPESYIAFELMQNQHMEHSLSAAGAIQKELVASAGRLDKGVRQAMFWVLVKTGMPAVLIELDFICNPRQERYLASEAGQTQLAEAIFNGLMVYKTAYDREMAQMHGTQAPEQRPKSAPAPANEKTSKTPASAGQLTYKIQFLVTSSPLSDNARELRGIDNPEYYRDGKSYKYTTGEFTDLSEANRALRKVKKLYPDAFVIKTRDGKRIK